MSTHRLNVSRPQYPGKNPLGIPDLLPTLLADPLGVEVPSLYVCGWTPFTPVSLQGPNPVFAWWTDDFRFQSTWTKPQNWLPRLAAVQPWAMIEPDHSTYGSDPPCLQYMAVYMNRWTGRYWQEHGYHVIPNVSWTTPESLTWSLYGIPRNTPCLAIEVRPKFRPADQLAASVRQIIKTISPGSLLLYGPSPALIESLPSSMPVIVYPTCHPKSRTTKGRWVR